MPRPQRKAPPYDAPAVTRLLERQCGLASRSQLAERGVTHADIRRAVRGRRLFALGSGIYVDTRSAPTPLQRAWWACLHYGRAALADETALQMARDESGKHLALPIRVAIGAARNVTVLPEVEVHRVSRLERVVGWSGSPPRMQPAHAALRVASRAGTDDDLVSRLAEAVNWRVATPARLIDALDDLPSLRRRGFIREVLLDLKAGACSVLEREYLRRVEQAHGLPTGTRQAPRRTPEGMEFRDVEYDAFGQVVEINGRAFHTGKRAWDKEMERELDDLLAVKQTARLGWRQVFGTPCRTAGKVGALLQRGGWSGSPRRCGPDCQLPRSGPP